MDAGRSSNHKKEYLESRNARCDSVHIHHLRSEVGVLDIRLCRRRKRGSGYACGTGVSICSVVAPCPRSQKWRSSGTPLEREGTKVRDSAATEGSTQKGALVIFAERKRGRLRTVRLVRLVELKLLPFDCGRKTGSLRRRQRPCAGCTFIPRARLSIHPRHHQQRHHQQDASHVCRSAFFSFQVLNSDSRILWGSLPWAGRLKYIWATLSPRPLPAAVQCRIGGRAVRSSISRSRVLTQHLSLIHI